MAAVVPYLLTKYFWGVGGGRTHLDIERIYYMPCFDKILFNLVVSEEIWKLNMAASGHICQQTGTIFGLTQLDH